MIVAVPLTGMTPVAVVSVIDEPDGARRGTRLHEVAMTRTAKARASVARRLRGNMKALTILIPMYLAGQGETARGARGRRPDEGYAMAALIVGIAVMAVLMTAAMPVWRQLAQREKEEELVFRGEQYAHAIGMFQRRTANAFPPNLDVLVQQKFLRKKYKDPITDDDFVPLGNSQAAGRGGQQQPGQGGAAQAGRGTAQPGAATQAPAIGGIIGVTSKSNAQSIRLYKGRSHYNEWAFVYIQQQQAAGAGAAGQATPGPGGQRGQRGQPGPPGSGGRDGRGVPPNGRGGPNGPGRGGFGTFGGGGVTPIQPPSTPRGRY